MHELNMRNMARVRFLRSLTPLAGCSDIAGDIERVAFYLCNGNPDDERLMRIRMKSAAAMIDRFLSVMSPWGRPFLVGGHVDLKAGLACISCDLKND